MNIGTAITRVGCRGGEKVAAGPGAVQLCSASAVLLSRPVIGSWGRRPKPNQSGRRPVSRRLSRRARSVPCVHFGWLDDCSTRGIGIGLPQVVGGYPAGCAVHAEVAVAGTQHERSPCRATTIMVPIAPDVPAKNIASGCEPGSNPCPRRGYRTEFAEAFPRTTKVDRLLVVQTFI